jgi:hypothetical protein
MIKVSPVTKAQYMTGYRRAFMKMKIFLGVCPICGKPVGGNGCAVYLNAERDAILTAAEALALPGSQLRYSYVGAACMRNIGTEYTFADHPEEEAIKADHNLVDYVK